MQLVKLKDGLELNVQILNPEAEKIVFMIHGMFGNLAQFYLTIAPLVAKKYQVVLFDLKSQGRSQRKDTGYDFDSFAQEVIELADALGCNKFSVLGYSFGCWVALRCQKNFPERVEKIVAIELPDWQKNPMVPRGFYTEGHFMEFVSYVNNNVRENFFGNKRQMRNMYSMHDYVFNHTTFSEDMNRERELQRDDFQGIEAPILLAFGRHSVCFPELMRIVKWVPYGDVYVEDGGHDFFLEKTKNCAQRIISFLDAIDRPVNNYYEHSNAVV